MSKKTRNRKKAAWGVSTGPAPDEHHKMNAQESDETDRTIKIQAFPLKLLVSLLFDPAAYPDTTPSPSGSGFS